MGEKNLGIKVREAIKAIFKKRTDPKRLVSQRRMITIPSRPRYSTRGERKPTYYTKRWTPSRLKDRTENMLRDQQEKAKAREAYVEREGH